MWTKFEIVSAGTTDCKKKYVLYNIKIQSDGLDNDSHAIFLERRYTDFLELYNSLREAFPELIARVSFPRKVLIGNFSSELIKTRLLGLENFLRVISGNNALLDSREFRTFLIGQEEKIAKKFLEAKKYSQAKPLLEKNFKILNKIFTERHPSVIVSLCRLAACCSADPASLEDASKYAEIALRRFDGISDVDLLCHYVPLLKLCSQLREVLGRDKESIEVKLNTLKCRGHKVDGCRSLLESMLAIE